jgi:hypothetical protein
MAKWANDAVMDAALDYIDQCDKMTVCNAQPTTYAEANATFALADVAMTPDTDYTKANGDTSGRKITVAAKSAVLIDTTGTATHVALIRTTDSSLRYVTTCTSKALTAADTVNIPAWDIEIGDPA